MMSTAWVHTMAQYNRWMNDKLYEVCAGLDEANLKKDRGAFFKSIHGTLSHLLLTDHVWYGRFTHEPFALQGLDQVLYDDFDDLWSARKAMDDRLDAWFAGLTDAMLAAEFRFESFTRPGIRSCPLWQALAHLFNHQTHHRGQLTTLLSQCGIDPGVTDLIAMPGVVTLQPE